MPNAEYVGLLGVNVGVDGGAQCWGLRNAVRNASWRNACNAWVGPWHL